MKDGISIVMSYHYRKEQLIRTLMSIMNSIYDKSKLEVIIVNDASDYIDDIKNEFPKLNIIIYNIKIEEKTWINSCVPFNIGFYLVNYNKVIIQNPECYHKGDIIKHVYENLTNENYLSFGTYSLSFDDFNNNDYDNINVINEKNKVICNNGWYNHSIYHPQYYHFCSAISYDNLCKLNGFDENYKDGIGYDDNEFLHRIKLLGLELQIIDNPFVYHQFHNSIFHYNETMDKNYINNINVSFEKNKILYINNTLLKTSYKIINNTMNLDSLINKDKVEIDFKNDKNNKKNIGVTVQFSEKDSTIWLNGIKQNVFFFTELLMNINKYNVYLVNMDIPIDKSLTKEWDINKFKIVMYNDIKDDLDLLIIMGSALTEEEGIYQKSRGCKMVYYNCGNQYIFDTENILFGTGKGTVLYKNYIDEIWMIPQMENSSYHYVNLIYDVNVKIVPFVWNSIFIDNLCIDLPNNGKYTPSDSPKRISIFEPNINLIKYCMYPILITEKLYKKNKKIIKHLYVTNSTLLRTKEKFISIMKCFSIVNDGIATFEDRFRTPIFLSEYTDIVVSHQIENALNYAYLDALYLGYPLIHNAHFIKDGGYYYDGFDVEEGSNQLENAIKNHDSNIEEYEQRSKIVLDRYLPTNQSSIDIYDKHIIELLNK